MTDQAGDIVCIAVGDGSAVGGARTLSGIEKEPFDLLCPGRLTTFMQQVAVGIEQFKLGAVFVACRCGVSVTATDNFVTDRSTAGCQAWPQFIQVAIQ